MRWWALVVAAAAACGDNSPGRPRDASVGVDAIDAGVDAPPILPAPACTLGGTVPALPETCVGAWCWDAPKPLGMVQSALADGADLWFAIPGEVVHVSGAQATAIDAPAAIALAPLRLVGGGAAGIWASYGGAARLDGSTWTIVADSVTLLAPHAPDDAWGVLQGALEHYDGTTWSAQAVPIELADPSTTFVAAAASSAGDLWIATTGPGGARFARLAAGTWTLWPAPGAITSIAPIAANDVWLAADRLYHWDGAHLTPYAVTPGELVARASDDVWAVDRYTGTVSHWDGSAWSSCTVPGAVAAAPIAAGDVWAARGDGSLAHFDGTAWSSTSTIDQMSDIAAIPTSGAPQVLAIAPRGTSSTVWRRASDGTWAQDLAYPGGAAAALAYGAVDDVWAYGTDALHFDGSTWTDTHAIDPALALCSSGSGTALAASAGGFDRYDGSTWAREATVAARSVFCLPGGDAWGAIDVYQIAHRSGGHWTWTPPEEELYYSYSPAAGQLWTLVDGVSHLAGSDWQQDPLTGLDTILPLGVSAPMFLSVTGTSATSLDFLVTIYTDPVTIAEMVVHHDGTQFVAGTTVSGVAQIAAAGPDDLMLVHGEFTTEDLHGGVVMGVSGGVSGDSIVTGGSVWFASPTVGFATSSEGHFLRFDGAGWTRDATYPATYAQQLLAFSDHDLWMIADNDSLAHYDGTTWSVTALPSLPSGDVVLGLWGSATTDLWAASQSGLVWHVVSGTPQLLDPQLPSSELPSSLFLVSGTSASDVWFSGRHYSPAQGIYDLALYHWDGQAFARYRVPRELQVVALVAGEVLASSYDPDAGRIMWQHTSGGWILRPDLDPAVVFPYPPTPTRPPFDGNVFTQAGPPWWSVAGTPYSTDATLGGVIWRHD